MRRLRRTLRIEALQPRVALHAEAVLSGSVFFDADGNGQRDAGEFGVPGIVLELVESGSTEPLRDVITDHDGGYSFEELLPGTYTIHKRQSPATINLQDSTSAPDAVPYENQVNNVILSDDQTLGGMDFAELGLRPEMINVSWFFASAPPQAELLREAIARSEELAGNSDLAAAIREGVADAPDAINRAPMAADDVFSVDQNQPLVVDAGAGLLANDSDPDGDSLTAALVNQAANGVASVASDGSFTYTPDTDFAGTDSFTYQASDGEASSGVATVRINVDSTSQGELFGEVTTGSFEDAGLLGIRTDLVVGAPPITADHLDGDLDYTGFSNPPTYGDHHGFDPNGVDINPGITPRPTGVYTTPQPDEDLIHNLEHGHVWISYQPDVISDADRAALEQLVLDGSPNPNGNGVGVILTPRPDNDTIIALASWAHLLRLDNFDPEEIYSFVETNRGHAPEGFITP